MPEKKILSERGVVEVTFELPADVKAETVQLVGDFTNWEGVPMKRQEDGSWRTTLELPPGRTYQFRYLADNTRWENDWNADDYTRNAYGQDNSVIHTPRLDATAARSPADSRRENAGDSAARTSATRTSPAKKTPAKTSAAKKTAAKTSPAKTSPAKTSPAKTSAAKTSAAKTSAEKKTAEKKTAEKKTAEKTSSAKTSPAKTSPAKTSPAKASPAKTSPAKTSPAKRTAEKTSPAAPRAGEEK